jgi:hypothetical protein
MTTRQFRLGRLLTLLAIPVLTVVARAAAQTADSQSPDQVNKNFLIQSRASGRCNSKKTLTSTNRIDARGTLLKVAFSHKDIASVVGASRPRVTEHLARLERDHYLFRLSRQFIVSEGILAKSLAGDLSLSMHATTPTQNFGWR